MTPGQQLIVMLVTLAAGWLMMFAGFGKKRLAWRSPGHCRRCGRPLESCSCPQKRRR